METLSALLARYEGNPPVTGGFPAQKGGHSGASNVSCEKDKRESSNEGKRNRSALCRGLVSLARYLLPTWTTRAKKSPIEEVVSNTDDLQHASNDNLSSESHADTDLISC